jgi:hypothetical protein
MEDKCFECETTEDLQQHHVVPRSRGGTKTVTLCHSCHMKAHGRDSKGLNHSRLTKEGLARARARGVKLGNLESLQVAMANAAKTNRERGEATVKKYKPFFEAVAEEDITSINGTAKRLGQMGIKTPRGRSTWSRQTVRRIMKALKQEE